MPTMPTNIHEAVSKGSVNRNYLWKLFGSCYNGVNENIEMISPRNAVGDIIPVRFATTMAIPVSM